MNRNCVEQVVVRPQDGREKPVPPPSRHAFAVMIWVCVFPTLTLLNLALGSWLVTLGPVLRTFVLATIAVPTISYAVMPGVQSARAWLIRAHRTV